MFQSRLGKLFIGASLFSAVGLCLAFVGCGNTGGGEAGTSANGNGATLVSNGGFGATINLTFMKDTLAVGETMEFLVDLRDPQGAPLDRVQIFCESEKGIAIIEPSSGGVAFEHTNADGRMSGVIGGLLPGSFMMECRAQEGFNLTVRKSLKITGSVPANFQGLPGAAGGNLGGGVIINQTPSLGSGLRVTAFQVTDAGPAGGLGPIDVVQEQCRSGSGSSATITPEPFKFTNYDATFANNSNETVIVSAIIITSVDGTNPNSQMEQDVALGATEVMAGQSIDIKGILGAGCAQGQFCLNDGSDTVVADLCTDGVALDPVDFKIEIIGTTTSGNAFDISRVVTITFSDVNNCPSGTTPTSSLSCPG